MMQSIIFSIIIPVYNRPEEVRELLDSLTKQTYKDFEVVIVEDGSQLKSEDVVAGYPELAPISYYYKKNEGPGLSRNYGATRANGNYFIFFDSDCLIPENYMEIVSKSLQNNWMDAYGGPDASHPSFTDIQKAISYSMTSFFTTGGIRGGNIDSEKFHPRSFNMGFSKAVFKKTSGFANIRFGEDLDMSMRIRESGSTAGLIKEAFVYHKRRTDFWKFYKQIYNSGIARINLNKRHPGTLKAVHFAPAIFVLFFLCSVISLPFLFLWPFYIICIYFIIIFLDALRTNKNINVAGLAVISTFVQHWAYGTGFMKSFWKRIILNQPEFNAFSKNLYK